MHEAILARLLWLCYYIYHPCKERNCIIILLTGSAREGSATLPSIRFEREEVFDWEASTEVRMLIPC